MLNSCFMYFSSLSHSCLWHFVISVFIFVWFRLSSFLLFQWGGCGILACCSWSVSFCRQFLCTSLFFCWRRKLLVLAASVLWFLVLLIISTCRYKFWQFLCVLVTFLLIYIPLLAFCWKCFVQLDTSWPCLVPLLLVFVLSFNFVCFCVFVFCSSS